MKAFLKTIVLSLLLIGCNTLDRGDKITDDTHTTEEIDSLTAVPHPVASTEAIWYYTFNEQNSKYEISKLRQIKPDDLNGTILEKIINKSYPKVQIIFLGTSNDTAFITVPSSEALTQQMGSFGAENFLVVTTYSFTELKGISYVSIDFEEGDHAVPGIYSRKAWEIVEVVD
jgi:hypothetical protein